MANPTRLTGKLLVSAQLQKGDLAALNAVGVKLIICNRPDGEAPDQPTFQELSETAEQLGMTMMHLPATPKLQMRPGDPEKFGEALEGSDGEVVAYCRTGMRSVAMWALSQRGKLPVEEIIRTAAQSGFDIAKLADQLEPGSVAATSSVPATSKEKRGFLSRLFGGR